MIKVNSIKPNPYNPRLIKDEKMKKLMKSIQDFPQMMPLRPIVIDENRVALGGNMRLQAIIALGFTEIDDSWVKQITDLTEAQKREFVIKDNVAFGENDWDELANTWEVKDLEDWGMDIPNFKTEKAEDDTPGYADMPVYYLNIKCLDEKHAESLYEKLLSEGLDVKIVT